MHRAGHANIELLRLRLVLQAANVKSEVVVVVVAVVLERGGGASSNENDGSPLPNPVRKSYRYELPLQSVASVFDFKIKATVSRKYSYDFVLWVFIRLCYT